VFDTTYWISYNLAPATGNCFGAIIQVVNYTITQKAKFTNLNENGKFSIGSWLAAAV